MTTTKDKTKLPKEVNDDFNRQEDWDYFCYLMDTGKRGEARSLILYLLSSQKQQIYKELREKIEKMKKLEEKWMLGMDAGYNQALSDILKIL